jgi:hypothetical protein
MPDESHGDLPIAIVTAQFNGDRVIPGTAQYWRLVKLGLQRTHGRGSAARRDEVAQRFGLADLAFRDSRVTYHVFVLHLNLGSGWYPKWGRRLRALVRASSGMLHEELDQIDELQELSAPGLIRIHGRTRSVGNLAGPLPSPGASLRPPERIPEVILDAILNAHCAPILKGHARTQTGVAEAQARAQRIRDEFLDRLAESVFRDAKDAHEQAQLRLAKPKRESLSRADQRVREPTECLVHLAIAATPPDTQSPSLRFAAGCCRYPGVTFDREQADLTLSALEIQAGNPEGPAFALMLGDQIYADSFNGVLDIADRLEKYISSYQRAFGSNAFAALARKLPLYMVPDDHEIKDNWPASLPEVRTRRLPLVSGTADGALTRTEPYGLAWRAYLGHQRAFGPPPPVAPGAAPPHPPPLWYEFDAGPVAFFVLDTRFERELGRDDLDPDLMSRDQWEALGRFLTTRASAQSGQESHFAPTFVVSGSVLAPGLAQYAGALGNGRRADTWQRYPRWRADLLTRIATLNLQNVVFLSGDYHCAAVGAVTFQSAPTLRAYAIVAPALYAPMPFLNTGSHEVAIEEEILALNGSPMATCRALASDVTGYALISVKQRESPTKQADDWSISVDLLSPDWSGNEQISEVARSAELAQGRARWSTG